MRPLSKHLACPYCGAHDTLSFEGPAWLNLVPNPLFAHVALWLLKDGTPSVCGCCGMRAPFRTIRTGEGPMSVPVASKGMRQ
jgi:hypothetical protein